jgi:xanthine dehydrogenase accessory factor
VTVELEAVERDLRERGLPFALATVVWRRSPSSAKVGARALVTVEGQMRGWLAGACAEPAVIGEAKKALREGSPRLVFIGPPEEIAEHARDGVTAVPIACQSEGALEVYVEPVLPNPQLIVIGRSPAVDALARMAGVLGWRTVVVDEGGSADDHPGVERVETMLDLAAAGVGAGSFVVVATQGHYDEDALEQALATDATYIGLVASRKRADSVLAFLRDRGVSDEQLARVHAPAGLDLGSVATDEIGVAVLADLVRLRAEEGLGAVAIPAPSPETHEALDPICGMTVQVASARYRSIYEGQTYYFCSAGCLQKFEESPAEHATVI